jgi:Domain of unknown function (DUF6597)
VARISQPERAMSTDAIRIREYPIHPALAPYVKCVWSLESDTPVHGSGRERILPDSCVELVFHFHDPYRTHPPQEKNPKGEAHEDVGFISYDEAAQKLVLRQFHSRASSTTTFSTASRTTAARSSS